MLTNVAVLGEDVSKEASPHSYFAFYFLPRHQLLTTERERLLQEMTFLYDHMQLT